MNNKNLINYSITNTDIEKYLVNPNIVIPQSMRHT